MTTLSAARQASKPIESGIRPFDIRRDLRPVAELISDAFASELDSRGTAALREMRIMGYMSGFINVLNRANGDFNDVFNGYVWVEDGKVVGNVTVQRADNYGDRWQIANVAVDARYRGKGIASRLMMRALDQIERSRGRWAVLQVYADNETAHSLYRHIGFDDVGGTVDLRLERVSPVGPVGKIPNFHSFSTDRWQALYDLANSQRSPQNEWWRSLRRMEFQVTLEQQIAQWFWRVIGRRDVFRRSIQISDRFEAALILTAQRWKSEHKLSFWIRPERQGEYEAILAHWTIAQLQGYPRLPTRLTLNTEQVTAIEAFQAVGFKPQHALLTMRKEF